MRLALLLCAMTAWGQKPLPSALPSSPPLSPPLAVSHAASHPSWWTYAPPDATALVGVRWSVLRESRLAGAIEDELWPGSAPSFALECLLQAHQFLLASPQFLAIAYGDYPVAKLRTDAAQRGLKRVPYKGVDLWVSATQNALSIASLNAQILLVGDRKALEAAIDRMPTEKTASDSARQYSPLLVRAAAFADQDLWIVSSTLPEPLASRFVPFAAEASGFAGGISVSRGLRLEATLETGSEQTAEKLAARLRQNTASLPSVARGMQIVRDAQNVSFALDVTGEQLQASLRPESEQETAPDPAVRAPAPVVAKVAVNGIPIQVDPPAFVTPVTLPVTQQEPPRPPPPGKQMIRIFGLDEGVREIELPPVR